MSTETMLLVGAVAAYWLLRKPKPYDTLAPSDDTELNDTPDEVTPASWAEVR